MFFNKILWVVIFVTQSGALRSQKPEFEKLPLLYYSEQKGTFCAIEDSILYQYTADGSWIRKKLNLHDDMKGHIINSEYFPISNNSIDYFVSKGCGEVYHFLDSSFVRLDHSFAHRNQYAGNPFFYQNKLYFFGGYGLFTSKNILTYYSKNRGEWFLEYTDKGQMPSPRSSCYSKLSGNHFYLLSGIYHKNNVGEHVYDVWSYNLYEKRWKFLGNINPEIREVFRLSNTNTYSSSSYIVYGSRLFDPFPNQNKLVEYSNDEFARVMDIISDDKGNVLIAFRETNGKIGLQVTRLKQFLGQPRKSYQLYLTLNESVELKWISISLGCLFLIVIIVFFLIRKSRQNKGIILSESDIQICAVLQSNGIDGIELSALNQFLDDGQSNYEALKKRRELRLKELRTKLSESYNLPLNEVILEKKSEKDKRVKLFYLNPNIKIQ